MFKWLGEKINNCIKDGVNTLTFRPSGYEEEADDDEFIEFTKTWKRRTIQTQNEKAEYWLYGLHNRVMKDINTRKQMQTKIKIGNRKGINLMLCFHGNAETSYHSLSYLQPIVDAFSNEFLFALVEYPKFGNFHVKDNKRPTENDCYDCADAVFIDIVKLLISQNLSINQIYLFGRSIGTGMAIYMSCSIPRVDKLILIHPFMSITEVPFNPRRKWDEDNKMNYLLHRYNAFDSFTIIEKTNAKKILIIHAEDDPLINYNHSIQLSSKLSNLKKHVDLWLVPDGGHGYNFILPCEIFNDYDPEVDKNVQAMLKTKEGKKQLKSIMGKFHFCEKEHVEYGGNYVGGGNDIEGTITVTVHEQLKKYIAS